MEQLKKNGAIYKNQDLFCKYLTSYKRSKIYKEGIAMNHSKEMLINMWQ